MKRRKGKRYWWLIDLVVLNGFTIGAEVGCANGATTHRLLRYCNNLKLYAVDKWERVNGGLNAGGCMSNENGESGCEEWDPVRGLYRFNQVTRDYQRRLIVLRGDSVEMAEKVPDGSLDFVFIDADHRYPAVVADLKAWVPKLKSEGILCGHDIHLIGVRRAVEEKLDGYEEAVDHIWHCKKENYVS